VALKSKKYLSNVVKNQKALCKLRARGSIEQENAKRMCEFAP
jgi:hypothetical protein